MTLSADELERYARHIVLNGFGGPAQQKLKAARVLVIGAGGLGSPVLLYLAAAGVGMIGLIDDDGVSLSNLQRQVIHSTSDLGRPKVESARDALVRVNPHVRVETFEGLITETNAVEMIGRYDVVVDGSDNFATRYIVSDAAFHAKRPLVTAAVAEFDGSLTTLVPHLTGADGTPNPTYRCLFPEAPPAGLVPTCAETGILGALTGVVGSLQALEVLKVITGVGEPLIGRLLLIDTRAMRFETIRYRWNPANPLSGKNIT
jgi:adenylyltransferase/sulfurtransferase